MSGPLPFDNPTFLAARFAEGTDEERVEILAFLQSQDAIFGMLFRSNLPEDAAEVLFNLHERFETEKGKVDPIVEAIEKLRREHNHEIGEKRELQYMTIQLHARLQMITGLASDIVFNAHAVGLPQKHKKALETVSQKLQNELDASFKRVNDFMKEGMWLEK